MTARANLVRVLGAAWVLVALAGCATSGERSRYLQHLRPESITNLTAYCAGTNLEIRFPIRGKDAFAQAGWTAPATNAPGCQHQFAVLTFEPPELATRKTVMKRDNRVAIRDSRQWQQLMTEVLRGLAPSQRGHGVVLLVQNQEAVIFRDENGRLNAVELEHKPPDVTVDRTFSDAEFSGRVIPLLQSVANISGQKRSRLLFVTGGDPPFVFVDLESRLMVFLSAPTDPETRPLEVPGWFALRALNSLLIKSFVITAIKNPFTLVSRGIWHIGNVGATMIESGSAGSTNSPPPLSTGPPMDLAGWEGHLDQLVSARPYKGRVDFLIDGEQFFPALVQSIQNSTQRVDVSVFIFDTDDYAIKIADLLKQRSAKVPVRVLFDDLGSLFAAQVPPRSAGPPDFHPPDDIESYLKSGSRVRVRAAANPWLTVDHRKCIIIDSRQAYVGGMNIGREYRYEWHDMMMGLTGPIVGRLEKDYRKAWAHAGIFGDYGYAWASLFDRVNARRMEITNGIDIRPLRTATFKTEIYRAQLEAIQHAQRYIYIENAYFDDDTTTRALIEARRRGVDVRVVLPAENDSGIMQTSNQIRANEMVQNGIRVYAYPGMTHVKAAIYDGWACLGSANFDKMSLRISQELDVAFSDPATVNRLERGLFEADFRRSHELTTPLPFNWFDSFVKAFADQL